MRVHVCLDLDGTTLDAERRAPVEELRRLHATVAGAGGRVTVATARCIQDVARLLRDVPEAFDAWCSDGACRGVVEAGAITQVMEEQAVRPADAGRMTAELLARDAGALLFTTSVEDFAIIAHERIAREALALLNAFGDERPIQLVDDVAALRAFADTAIVRAVSVLGRSERTAPVVAALPALPATRVLHYTEDRAAGYSWIDVVDASVSKAGAVRALREEGCGPSIVVAAGNGLNDLRMFDAADWTVCPLDSALELAAIADIPGDVQCGPALVDRVRREVIRLQGSEG